MQAVDDWLANNRGMTDWQTTGVGRTDKWLSSVDRIKMSRSNLHTAH